MITVCVIITTVYLVPPQQCFTFDVKYIWPSDEYYTVRSLYLKRLDRKENELRRKYRVFGGSTEKKIASPNFRDRTKWMVSLDLARLRVYKTVFFFHLSSKRNFI